ncbi:MAG: hypothetical protein ABIJ09_26150 [Pseudomonadota bacterium]
MLVGADIGIRIWTPSADEWIQLGSTNVAVDVDPVSVRLELADSITASLLPALPTRAVFRTDNLPWA